MATYGIDLGTTNSCIAYVDDTGRPVVLKSAVVAPMKLVASRALPRGLQPWRA